MKIINQIGILCEYIFDYVIRGFLGLLGIFSIVLVAGLIWLLCVELSSYKSTWLVRLGDKEYTVTNFQRGENGISFVDKKTGQTIFTRETVYVVSPEVGFNQK